MTISLALSSSSDEENAPIRPRNDPSSSASPSIQRRASSRGTSDRFSPDPAASSGASSVVGIAANVLGTNYRYAHANSPSRQRSDSQGTESKSKRCGDKMRPVVRKHISWEDQGPRQRSWEAGQREEETQIVSPSHSSANRSIDRSLEEQGIVGVFVHDDFGGDDEDDPNEIEDRLDRIRELEKERRSPPPPSHVFVRAHSSSPLSQRSVLSHQGSLNSAEVYHRSLDRGRSDKSGLRSRFVHSPASSSGGSRESREGSASYGGGGGALPFSDLRDPSSPSSSAAARRKVDACRRLAAAVGTNLGLRSLLPSTKPLRSSKGKRLLLLSLGLTVASLGYLVEIRRVLAAVRPPGGRSEWLAGLPWSLASAASKSGLVGKGASKPSLREYDTLRTPVASMAEEARKVRELKKARAWQRRNRTRPPSARPAAPAEAAAEGATGAAAGAGAGAAAAAKGGSWSTGIASSFGSRSRAPKKSEAPPRLTLDLPAHRELDRPGAAGKKTSKDRRGLRSEIGAADAEENDGAAGHRHLKQPAAEAPPSGPEICGPHAREASEKHPGRYPPEARIGPKSRVVVTGALSQVGMELILQLHEQCGVQFVAGIDPVYPNTRHERIEAIEHRYKYIQRRVPAFQRLIVPLFGIHPHPYLGEERRLERDGNGFDLVKRLNPTHIVHLAGTEEGRGEHVDYGDVTDASPLAEAEEGGDGSVTMRRFDALLSMDQVLRSLADFRDRFPQRAQPQLVYLSSHEAEDRSGVASKVGDATVDGASVPRASVYGTSSLLKEVLASYYYKRHGVESFGLRIPMVFGPFARPGSVMHDLAERTVHNAVEWDPEGRIPPHRLDGDRYELSTMFAKREGAEAGAREQLAYVYDVAAAIIAALQFRRDPKVDPNAPVLARIGSGSELTTSMREMQERMEEYLPPASEDVGPKLPSDAEPSKGLVALESPGPSDRDAERVRDLLGWTHGSRIHDAIKSTLAYHVLKAYPYSLPPVLPIQNKFQGLIDDSIDNLSYHSLPCAAGCRWGGNLCTPSPWDAVIETTREITQSCPYVLYTVDLHPELASMERQSKPSQRKGWEEFFCKIAFVSSSSKLAKSMYGEDLTRTPMSEWNGKIKNELWIIVVVPGSQHTMPEYERSMAKLTPTQLFHERVEKAMYLHHRRVILTTDQAMGVMRHLEMHARNSPEKKTIYDEKKKENVDIWLPPQPRRHSLFFTNRYTYDENHSTNPVNLAKFVRGYTGIPETKDMRAQVQFYEMAVHLTRTNAGRSPNYQEMNQESYFPLDFIRSTWLVHELRSEEGRMLRCEMYEEHSLWGNQEMEDLSMGYVLARKKVLSELGKFSDSDYTGPEKWYPLLTPKDPEDEGAIAEGSSRSHVYLDYLEENQKVATDSRGHEYYITFLPQKLKK